MPHCQRLQSSAKPAQKARRSRARRSRTHSRVLRDIPGFTIVQTARHRGVTSLFARGGNSNFNQALVDGVKANEVGGFYL